MRLIAKATEVARRAHNNQTYSGLSYFEGHLKPVSDIVKNLGGDSQQVAIALLHDILEDTFYPREELLFQFGQRVYNGVVAVTFDSSLYPTRRLYLNSVVQNSDAALVKYADSLWNLKTSTEELVTASDLEDFSTAVRRIKKYTDNIAYLKRYL